MLRALPNALKSCLVQLTSSTIDNQKSMTHFSRLPYQRNRLFKPAALTAASLAVLAVSALPCTAHAQVTLYGAVDSGVTYVNNVRTTANAAGNYAGSSVTRMANGVVWGSRFGLKGTEDLGGGNQVIFTLENGFTPSNGALGNSGRLFGRQAFVGLANSQYGTVTLGRQYDSANEYVGNLIYGMGSSFVHVGDLDHLDTIARGQRIEIHQPADRRLSLRWPVFIRRHARHDVFGLDMERRWFVCARTACTCSKLRGHAPLDHRRPDDLERNRRQRVQLIGE